MLWFRSWHHRTGVRDSGVESVPRLDRGTGDQWAAGVLVYIGYVPAQTALPLRQRLRPHLPDVLAALLIAAVTALICLPGIARFSGVSLYDEMTHVDYAYRIAFEQRVPRAVEPLSDTVLEEWACRPSAWNPDEELCDLAEAGRAEPEEFPADGANYNGFHPPLYYALTGVGARGLLALTSPLTDLSLVVAMRVMSMIWLSAGLIAFYGTMRMWLTRRSLSLAITLALGTTPAIASFGMQVNPDATAVLAGAAAVYLAHRIFHGRPSFAAAAILALLVASTKLLAVVAIFSVVTVARLRALIRMRKEDRRTTLAWAAPFGGALLGTGLSHLISELLTRLAGPPTQDNPIIGLSSAELTGPFTRPLVDTLAINADLVSMYWLPAQLDSTLWGMMARVTGLLLIAAVGILLAAHRSNDPRFLLALSTAAGTLSVPIVIQIRQLLVNNDYFAGVAARYAITIIPLAFACAGLVLVQRRWGAAAAWIFAGITTVIALESTTGVLTL